MNMNTSNNSAKGTDPLEPLPSAATPRPGVRRLDLKVGFRCNNLCDFCAQGDKRETYPQRPFSELRDEMKRAREAGITSIVFTGGEPSLHSDILELVREARTLGFTALQLQTNGRRLAYEKFCRELLEAGITEASPSLHGSKSEIHDALTCAPGAFAQTVRGILNVRRLGIPTLINSVVTAQNYRDLPALARLLISLHVNQFQFAFIHIVGRPAANPSEVVPRKTDAIPYIHQGLSLARQAGVRAYTEAVPFCLMRGFEDCVAETIMPDARVADVGRVIEHYEDYRWTEGKAKGPRCAVCVYDKVCEGPWREYPELFGWDEFVPVPRKS